MNLLDKIKADIARREVMACHDLDGLLASIDFQALSAGSYDDTPSHAVNDGVATIKVRGLLIPQASRDYGGSITGYNIISDYLTQANNNPMVKSIVLDIDSQGGYLKGLHDVVEQIDNLSKPIGTHATGNMQSAAYWLGISTNSVTADKGSQVGSIGVYAIHGENSQELATKGITMSLFKSGDWKGAFNSFMPLSQKEKDRLQANIDESANAFFNFVAYKRGLTAQTVADWQGDTFNATKAKEYGLIDEIVGTQPTISSHIPTKAELSATNPQEIDMDLVQALAENSNLKGQLDEKDTALQAKDKQIAELQQALSEQQASARQKQIDELAQATGKTFGDDEVAAFKAMDDAGFELVVSLATAKPTMPKGLDKPQANAGINAGTNTDTQSLSGKVAAWGKQ